MRTPPHTTTCVVLLHLVMAADKGDTSGIKGPKGDFQEEVLVLEVSADSQNFCQLSPTS